MTCSSAAVEPTSDSALPIRAKLFGDPNIDGTWVARLITASLNQRGDQGLRSPQKSEIFGGRDFVLPIRAELDGDSWNAAGF